MFGRGDDRSSTLAVVNTMSQEELLAQLKKDVRSLLVSSKLGLEVNTLRRDYVSILGRPMPLKQLGFRNVLDMVTEMPDVVAASPRADGSVWLTAVGDETTRNMEELVAKQRSKTPKNVERRLYSPRTFYSKPATVLPRRGRPPAAVPAQLAKQLRILLSQGPVLTSDLESCFQRCFGYPLRPENYGFFSKGEMLEAAGGLIYKHQTRLGSAVSLRKPMLLSEVCTPSVTPRRTGPIKSVPVRSHLNAQRLDTTSKLAVKPQAHLKQSPARQSLTLATVTSQQKTSEKSQGEPEVFESDGLYQKQVLKLEEELRQKMVVNGVAGNISQELKDKLRKVVRESSNGLSVHSLPAEYKRLYGEDLPLQQNGFVSATEMVSSLIDTFQLKPVDGVSGQQWIVVDILHTDVTQSDPGATRSLDDSENEPSARNNVVDPESPRSEPEQENDYATVCEKIETSNGFKTPEMVYCRGTVPPDAVQNQRLQKPRRLSPREMVQAQVEEVDSPGHFYVSFLSEEDRTMDKMMIEMRRCYNYPEVSERYCLLEQFVRPGQVCCVSPKGLWFYRAVIHKITSPSEVEVFFVDFGSSTVVPTTSLKFLKSCYSVLPAQAALSSLAGIKPSTGGWSAEATASFQKMCCTRPLVCISDCYAGDVLLLYLCDTHTDDDIYVHSVLLSQGHGTACSTSAIAPLCAKASPVSLYLGEGMIELPEIKEASSVGPGVSTVASVKEEDDFEAFHAGDEELPGLDLVEDVEADCQHQDFSLSSLSSPLLTDPAVACSSSYGAPSTESPTTSPPSPTSDLHTSPDLIQSETDVATSSACDATTTPSPALSSDTTAPCWPTPEDKQDQRLAATRCMVMAPSEVTALSLHMPDFSQCFPGSPVKLRKSGFPFPLFGTM